MKPHGPKLVEGEKTNLANDFWWNALWYYRDMAEKIQFEKW